VSWPVLESLLDKVWSPVTGGILVVTGLILLTTTVLTVRAARGEATTYTDTRRTGGSSVYRPASER
jgi:hypothetical protein